MVLQHDALTPGRADNGRLSAPLASNVIKICRNDRLFYASLTTFMLYLSCRLHGVGTAATAGGLPHRQLKIIYRMGP